MKKRIVSLLLALVMALTLTLPAYAEGGSAASDESITYKVWDDTKMRLVDATTSEYTVVAGSESNVTWNGGVYVVKGDVGISEKLTVYGDVHLILCDNATLTVEKGVVVNGGDDGKSGKLTIYGQTEGNGKLVASGSAGNTVNAGIKNLSYGPLTINGGEIEATGSSNAVEQPVSKSYGIFSGYVVINSGKVTATGGTAVVSTSDRGQPESGGIYAFGVTVNGGEVIATGGEVTATDTNGRSYGIQAALEINGGTVTAKGGEATDGDHTYSYGIYAGDNMDMDVYGGTVTATGGDVTGGYAESYGIYVGTNLTIENGTVNADGGKANADKRARSCGIYVYGVDTGDDNGLTVKGGNITATGGEADGDDDTCSHGIRMEDGDLIIEGGTVNATGNKAKGDDDVKSCGIYVCTGDMTIKGENTTVNANGDQAEGDDAVKSCGIYVVGGYDDDEGRYGNLDIEGGTVNATGNKAEADYGDAYSYGIRVYAYLYIEDSVVTATGGEAKADDDEDAYSCGIYVKEEYLTIKGGRVTATGGEAIVDGDAYSYGIYFDHELYIEYGTVIAKTTATEMGEKAAVSSEYNVCYMPDHYKNDWQWRTMEKGDYSAHTAFYLEALGEDYFELVAAAPEVPETPDSSTNHTGGGIHRPSSNQTAEVKSPETFDPGIAAYVVMGGISTVTSAAWLRRRKK